MVTLLAALIALTLTSMKFMDPWKDIFDERNTDVYVDNTANGVSDAHLFGMTTPLFGKSYHICNTQPKLGRGYFTARAGL